MIRGIVNYEDVPMVTFPIAGQTLDAIVDTGFNGDLELPDSLRSFLTPRFLCRIRSFLASGQSIEEDNYLVDLTFDDRTASVEATFSPGSEILISRGIQLNCRSMQRHP